jgi:hypothetical protein
MGCELSSGRAFGHLLAKGKVLRFVREGSVMNYDYGKHLMIVVYYTLYFLILNMTRGEEV